MMKLNKLFQFLQNKDFWLCVFSAALLIFAFPKIDLGILGWIGLVPLMLALEGKNSRQAFGLSYLCGIIFFTGTLYWFIYVDVLVAFIGAPLLILYLSLFFGFFGLIYSHFSRSSRALSHRNFKKLKFRFPAVFLRKQSAGDKIGLPAGQAGTNSDVTPVPVLPVCRQTGKTTGPEGKIVHEPACRTGRRKRVPILRFVVLPGAWVVLEWIRANFLTGFGWVSLAHSQYKNLFLIQIADLTGVFGISFLIVLVNLLIREGIFCLQNKSRGVFRQWWKNLCLPILLILLIVLGYGLWQISLFEKTFSHVKAVVIQGNILQWRKWLPSEWASILQEYKTITQKAAQNRPDIIIWPETAFPGILWEDEAYLDQLKELTAQLQIPLLLGTVINEEENYYNSALLISKEGEVVGRYDKMHLVAFGEYVPLRSLLPFLDNVVPIGDFTAGEEFTIFPAPAPFSVLICFEDTVPHLSREFVRRGAKVLVNITNDAWFEDTKEPFLHLQSAVFRSIENRRTLIRAANTGVSAFIDPLGRVIKTVERQGKKTYVSGYALASMPLNNTLTFYTRFGDVFVYLCFGIVLCGIILKLKKY